MGYKYPRRYLGLELGYRKLEELERRSGKLGGARDGGQFA